MFGRILQPSIIYIDDAEKTFLKKVPKTDKTDPKRLKKDLSKIVKSIGPSDLVCVGSYWSALIVNMLTGIA